MGSPLEELYDAILDGRRKEVPGLTQQALDSGIPATAIIEDTLRPAMAEVGDLFSRGEFFLPQLLLSASAMKAATEYLRPFIAGDGGGGAQETVVIGTVQGDVHDIGKNLVAATLEGAGYRVVDIGVDATPDKFIAAVRAENPSVIGFSALLSTTMIHIPKTIQALEAAGLRAGRVLAVGGAPVTQRNADEWGVEAYAADAGSAVRVITQALAARRQPAG